MSLVNLKPVFKNFMIGGTNQPIPLFELELNWNANSKDIIPSIARNEDSNVEPNENPVAPDEDPNVVPNENPNVVPNVNPVVPYEPNFVSEDRFQKIESKLEEHSNELKRQKSVDIKHYKKNKKIENINNEQTDALKKLGDALSFFVKQ